MTLTHKAEYLIPGFLFSEETVRTLPRRSVSEALAVAPEHSFCFSFYDVEETPDLGPDFTVHPKPKNRSGKHYIDGEVFTLEQVQGLGGDHGNLVANMTGNGWARVVRCRTGNWQPFEDNDQIVSAR